MLPQKGWFQDINEANIGWQVRRLERMSEICSNALHDNSGLVERKKKFEVIKAKYADLAISK